MGVGLQESVTDEVAVPVRDCELLGVPVPVAVAVELGERVCEALPVWELVEERLRVVLWVEDDVPEGDDVAVPELLGVELVVLVDELVVVVELLSDTLEVEAGDRVEVGEILAVGEGVGVDDGVMNDANARPR